MNARDEIAIRRAVAADAPGIAAILRELGWFSHINEESATDTAKRVSRHLEMCHADDSHMVLVAVDATGAAIGYVSVHWLPYLMLAGPEGFVSELFVLEAERGRGAGRMLLDAVQELARERRCVRLHLVNGSKRDSYQRRFYEKHRWKERAEIRDFILPCD